MNLVLELPLNQMNGIVFKELLREYNVMRYEGNDIACKDTT